MDRKPPLNTKDQTTIDILCVIVTSVIWVILLALAFVSDIFIIVLLAYNILGGLLNRGFASSTLSAILLAPIHTGHKLAMFVQVATLNEKLNQMTKKELIALNDQLCDILERHPNRNSPCLPCIFACETYKDLSAFNKRIVERYEELTKK